MSRLSPLRNRLFLGVFLSLLALAVSGCGTAKVSGTVKYKGKPLTSGSVIFVDKDGKATPPAYIKSDGTYVSPSVPTGSMTVVVDAPPPSPPESGDKNSPEYKEYETKLAAYVPIPARYRDPKTSGKTVEIKSGTPCDIELEGELEKAPVNDPRAQP